MGLFLTILIFLLGVLVGALIMGKIVYEVMVKYLQSENKKLTIKIK